MTTKKKRKEERIEIQTWMNNIRWNISLQVTNKSLTNNKYDVQFFKSEFSLLYNNNNRNSSLSMCIDDIMIKWDKNNENEKKRRRKKHRTY